MFVEMAIQSHVHLIQIAPGTLTVVTGHVFDGPTHVNANLAIQAHIVE